MGDKNSFFFIENNEIVGFLYRNLSKMEKFLYIGIGGFLGANARYLFSLLFLKLLGPSFPFGTLFVNVLGCFFIGFLMVYAYKHPDLSNYIKAFGITGFLGALTTFSTFGYETLACFESGNYFAGILNILLNMLVGLLAVFIGAYLANLG